MYKSRILIYTRRFTLSVDNTILISFSRRVYTFEKEDIIGENTSEKLELNAQLHNVHFYVVSPSYMYYTQYHNARAYCHKDEYLSSLPLVILLFIIILSVLFYFPYYYLVVPVNKMYLKLVRLLKWERKESTNEDRKNKNDKFNKEKEQRKGKKYIY